MYRVMVTTFQVDDDLAQKFRLCVRVKSIKKIKEEIKSAIENHIKLLNLEVK